jgi:hypothetical protein
MSFSQATDPSPEATVRVPAGWLPHVHADKTFWFWYPRDWSSSRPLSDGSCLALRSDRVLAEVFVLGPPKDKPDAAVFAAGIFKKSIVESHPDARVRREGNYSPPALDLVDALARMASLGLMSGYGFVTDMLRPTNGHRFTVEYYEQNRVKSVTDCFSLHLRDMVVQVNMKTLASHYQFEFLNFEQVATSFVLGRFA